MIIEDTTPLLNARIGNFIFSKWDNEIGVYEVISNEGFRPYATERWRVDVADFVNSGDVTGAIELKTTTIPQDIADKARDFFSASVPKNKRPY
jgi:hypothetical protein